MEHILIQTAIFILIYVTAVYLLAQVLRDNSIMDIGWGLGFILICIFQLLQPGNGVLNQYLISILLFIWGIRLSLHILGRNARKGEDYRYAEWRKKWGKNAFWIAYFKVFLLQGLVMLILSWPVVLIFSHPHESLSLFEIIGTAIFLTGFVIETLADRQLILFRKDPANRGKLLTGGLWKLSRHPNYMGESLLWCGVAIIALNGQWGWTGLISPILMYILLAFVSGVPLLEKKYKGHPDWEEYKKKTPPIYPRLF